MTAISFNHVSIAAKGLDESVAFYQDLFGLQSLPNPNFGMPVAWLRIGDLQLHLFERPDDPPVRHHFGLVVDDFVALYARARDAGLFDGDTFAHHLVELPNGIAQLYLRDPAGNLIEVDSPDAAALPEDIRADMVRLADLHPQSDANLRATLFPPFPQT